MHLNIKTTKDDDVVVMCSEWAKTSVWPFKSKANYNIVYFGPVYMTAVSYKLKRFCAAF